MSLPVGTTTVPPPHTTENLKTARLRLPWQPLGGKLLEQIGLNRAGSDPTL